MNGLEFFLPQFRDIMFLRTYVGQDWLFLLHLLFYVDQNLEKEREQIKTQQTLETYDKNFNK